MSKYISIVVSNTRKKGTDEKKINKINYIRLLFQNSSTELYKIMGVLSTFNESQRFFIVEYSLKSLLNKLTFCFYLFLFFNFISV